MTILFVSETLAFARSNIVTSITLDEDTQPQMRLNFNVTFLDLNCDYVAVDVLDSLGSNRQNVTKNVEKWQLDSDGNRRIFSGRNRETREVKYEVHDENEEHEGKAVELNKGNFDQFMKDHELAFVDFYAPWCMWCQRLHPTWQKVAGQVEEKNMPVGIAEVNCVTEADLCRDQKIQAFPTLRWYREGTPEFPDYKQDRTSAALSGHVKRKLEMNEKYKNWETKAAASGNKDKDRAPKRPIGRPDHPGCQVSGHLMVNRVPGNFHVEARSKNHNLNAAMTNLTHRVNHISFGEPVLTHHRKEKRILKQVPEEFKQFTPMDGDMFSTSKYHQAHHHYIKVVSTQFDMSGNGKDDSGEHTGKKAILLKDYKFMSTYQFLEQSQLVYYEDMDVPEARFSYDISPMSVLVQKENRKWYDYVTSLCAILGGTFTTLGLIDATLYRALKAKKYD
jgi:protein disulfide-isomerase-like protein